MAKQTIVLKNYQNVYEEFAASATITPGELIEMTEGYNTVRAHSTEHGNVLPMFAVEDALQGRGIDDDYSSGDKVRCWTPLRGDVVNAILEDGEAVSIGDFLESNGSGYLQKLVDTEGSTAASYDLIYSQPIVGIALENLDLSGSSGTGSTHESSVGTLGYNKRLQVKII